MLAAGIDLGGTKIEAQVFDADWRILARMRWPTPKSDYDAQVQAMADAVSWCEAEGKRGLPIGVSAAGLLNPTTGTVLTANLAASGQPFPDHIATRAGRPVTWLNDCRALALSEARFGAAAGAEVALALVFGTGLSGGVIVQGKLPRGFAGLGGEVGHFPLAAGPVLAHGLPVLACGCGRKGCVETLLSAPGLARIAQHVTGKTYDPKAVIAGRSHDAGLAKAWQIWLELACEFLTTLNLCIDPSVIVIGGGMSSVPNLARDLTLALHAATFDGFSVPAIKLAQGGDTSGARGAAYAAYCEAVDV